MPLNIETEEELVDEEPAEKKRKAVEKVLLTDDLQDVLVDWIREQPSMYNKNNEYSDPAKSVLCEEKAVLIVYFVSLISLVDM